VSSDFGIDLRKDPLFAVFSEHARRSGSLKEARDGDSLEGLTRDQLVARLNEESRAGSAWTVFFHTAVAHSLGLHPTDHKCLDLIWQAGELGQGVALTPGKLAQLTQLTTGAITGILDRLEAAGYVRREHDAEDRRRIIIRPVNEKVIRDLQPVFDHLIRSFAEVCSQYTDDELRLMIRFSKDSQKVLQGAIEHLKHANAASRSQAS
jgi:DNA-binding MarR family transcriptional regulator